MTTSREAQARQAAIDESNAFQAERQAARHMFAAVDAMMAAREQWSKAGRQDLIDELEPHYDAICAMGRREAALIRGSGLRDG